MSHITVAIWADSLIDLSDTALVLRSCRERLFRWKDRAAQRDYREALDAEMLDRGLLTTTTP